MQRGPCCDALGMAQQPLTWIGGNVIFPIRISRTKIVRCRIEMDSKFMVIASVFVSILVCVSCAENSTIGREDHLQSFFREREVAIAVVDSGLGGLSILADAVERSKEWACFRKVDFVYFNALFANEGGYNTLETHQEKVAIFQSALESLEHSFKPDLILIGCNTLSTLYDDTHFSKETKTPVRGIIDAGVTMACDALKAHQESKIILFATQTTAAQNTHKNLLLKKGFLPERILSQACPELARYIEEDYRGDETEMLIFAYVDEAIKNIGDLTAPLLVSFNCTHFGYSLDLWKKAFHSLGVEPLAFLNPNAKMNDFLFSPQYRNRFKSTHTSVRIVSMVEIGKKKTDNIGSLIHSLSPETAKALTRYEWAEDLFEWKSYIKSRN
jgi:glutamate racemase